MTNVLEDDMAYVVSLMRTDPIITSLGYWDGAPDFMFGHIQEMVNRQTAKGTNPTKAHKRYPFVALRLDAVAQVEGTIVKYSLDMAILDSTDKNYNAEQRLENVMKPKLLPLYRAFLKALKQSGRFTWDGGMLAIPPHTMIKRYFYGSLESENSKKNIFNDPLDAIEIADLKINSIIKTC